MASTWKLILRLSKRFKHVISIVDKCFIYICSRASIIFNIVLLTFREILSFIVCTKMFVEKMYTAHCQRIIIHLWRQQRDEYVWQHGSFGLQSKIGFLVKVTNGTQNSRYRLFYPDLDLSIVMHSWQKYICGSTWRLRDEAQVYISFMNFRFTTQNYA